MAMGKWFGKRAGDEPVPDRFLGTDASIAEFLASLPAHDPTGMLGQLCEALEGADAAQLDPPAFRNALRRLDNAAYEAVQSLAHGLFADGHGEAPPERNLRALSEYFRRIGGIYLHALEAIPESPRRDDDRVEATLLACRAMAALVRHKKLEHLAYRAPTPACWSAMAEVHRGARMRGVLEGSVSPFARHAGQSSTQAEFVRGLVIETAPLGSLTPPQIECLDLLLGEFPAALAFVEAPGNSAPFYFDFAQPAPPRRLLKGLQPRPSWRYVGAGTLRDKLAGLVQQARETHAIPVWAAPSACSLEAYGRLLGALHRHWSPRPPQRRDRRAPRGDIEVLLVHDLERARRMVVASEQARSGIMPEGMTGDLMRNDKVFDKMRFGSVSADDTTTGRLLLPKQQKMTPDALLDRLESADDKAAMDHSHLADTSDTGLGVHLPVRTPWARLGVLVAFRLPKEVDWRLAILRRLSREQGQLSAGFERLAGSAEGVRAMPVVNAAAAGTASMAVTSAIEGILLTGPATLLVLPPGRYLAGHYFAAWTQAARYALRVGAVRETGRDYRVLEMQVLESHPVQ